MYGKLLLRCHLLLLDVGGLLVDQGQGGGHDEGLVVRALIPDMRFLLIYPHLEQSGCPPLPGAVWLSSPTWCSVVVQGGGDIAASEELLRSQG